MISALLLAAALATAPAEPSAEAVALGTELSRLSVGTELLRMLADREVDELAAAHPELDAGDRATLVATAREVAEGVFARLWAANGRAYAEALSLDELRTIVAFERSPAAQHYRAVLPGVMARGMQSLGAVEFKGDAVKAFCAKTGKLCGPAK